MCHAPAQKIKNEAVFFSKRERGKRKKENERGIREERERGGALLRAETQVCNLS